MGPLLPHLLVEQIGTIRYFVDDVSIESACNPPSASWTNPSPACASAGTINLNGLITGAGGGTWSGTWGFWN